MRAMVKTQPAGRATPPFGLAIGEVVEVRSEHEILATLDERGELDGLPFMPEMLKFCGERLTVYRRAHRLCDTATQTGFHRLEHAVHLEGIRCDGAAHGGCQARCLLYWNEAWLRRPDDQADEGVGAETARERPKSNGSETIRKRQVLSAATRADGAVAPPGEECYACQATELMRAAPARLPWWDIRHYIRDVRSGDAKALPMVLGIFIMLFNKFQRANRKFFPWILLIRGGATYPFIAGTLSKTPAQRLGLQPGELVRIKSKEEIIGTLDSQAKNRGLSFDAEMLAYCGTETRVLGLVDRIIDEKTGRMLHLPNDCVILDGVICKGTYNHFCPRSIYPYWREIWLERVEPSSGAATVASPQRRSARLPSP
jgi:hypothetical protein